MAKSIHKRIQQAQEDSKKHKFFRENAFMVFSKGRCRTKVTAESLSDAVDKIYSVLYEATHHAFAGENQYWLRDEIEKMTRGNLTAASKKLPLVFDGKHIPVKIGLIGRNTDLPSDQPLVA